MLQGLVERRGQHVEELRLASPAAFNAFSYAAGWVSSSHANRSSGKSARSRS